MHFIVINFKNCTLNKRKNKEKILNPPVIPQLWVQVIQMHPYTPLWYPFPGFTLLLHKDPVELPECLYKEPVYSLLMIPFKSHR